MPSKGATGSITVYVDQETEQILAGLRSVVSDEVKAAVQAFEIADRPELRRHAETVRMALEELDSKVTRVLEARISRLTGELDRTRSDVVGVVRSLEDRLSHSESIPTRDFVSEQSYRLMDHVNLVHSQFAQALERMEARLEARFEALQSSVKDETTRNRAEIDGRLSRVEAVLQGGTEAVEALGSQVMVLGEVQRGLLEHLSTTVGTAATDLVNVRSIVDSGLERLQVLEDRQRQLDAKAGATFEEILRVEPGITGRLREVEGRLTVEGVELRHSVNKLSGEVEDLRAVSAETIGQAVGVLNEMGAQITSHLERIERDQKGLQEQLADSVTGVVTRVADMDSLVKHVGEVVTDRYSQISDRMGSISEEIRKVEVELIDRLGSAEDRAEVSRTQLGQSLAVLSDQLVKLSGIHMETRQAVSQLDVSVGTVLPGLEARSNSLEQRIGTVNSALTQLSDQVASDLGALGDRLKSQTESFGVEVSRLNDTLARMEGTLMHAHAELAEAGTVITSAVQQTAASIQRTEADRVAIQRLPGAVTWMLGESLTLRLLRRGRRGRANDGAGGIE